MLSDEFNCTVNFWDTCTPFIPEAGDTEKNNTQTQPNEILFYTFRLCIIPVTEYHKTDLHPALKISKFCYPYFTFGKGR